MVDGKGVRSLFLSVNWGLDIWLEAKGTLWEMSSWRVMLYDFHSRKRISQGESNLGREGR